ncbi:MAG: hypothetical protein AB7O67_16675 [Vicinamibacterales bacterium]
MSDGVLAGFGLAVVLALYSWGVFCAGLAYARKLVRFDVDLQEWSDDNRPAHAGKRARGSRSGPAAVIGGAR